MGAEGAAVGESMRSKPSGFLRKLPRSPKEPTRVRGGGWRGLYVAGERMAAELLCK